MIEETMYKTYAASPKSRAQRDDCNYGIKTVDNCLKLTDVAAYQSDQY